MKRAPWILVLLAAILGAAPDDEKVVFRSEVALARIDAQVLDRSDRTITGLRADDFELRLGKQILPVKNLVAEDMSMDLVLVLDVSGSMRPHIERIATAAHEALHVLGRDDRVAIEVFTSSSRMRLPFRTNRDEIERELDRIVDRERFNGGTNIVGAIVDAANYIVREGRRDARHAIVIVTDDGAPPDHNGSVPAALDRADAVLCALIAPEWDPNTGRQGGGYPGGHGGTWGSGPPVWGRGGGYPGGGGMGYPRNEHAGTAGMARDSGGDSMSIGGASALEDTLERLRQRYAIYYTMPEAAQPGSVHVDLASSARRRFPDAEIRYRRVHMGDTDTPRRGSEPTMVTQAPADNDLQRATSKDTVVTPSMRRRVSVNEDGTVIGVSPAAEKPVPASSSQVTPVTPVTSSTQAAQAPEAQQPKPGKVGGWRRVDDPGTESGPAAQTVPGSTTTPKAK